MAYSIATVLGNGAAGNAITIADGSLDSTSTLLSLPGRNYSGYGQPVDTNFVKIVQNFANSSVPGPESQLLAGQFWFDTSGGTANTPGTMKIYSGFPNVWLSVVASDPNNASGTTGFTGNLDVAGNVNANDASVTNNLNVGNVVTIGSGGGILNTTILNANGNATFSGSTTNVANLVTSNIVGGVSGTIQLTANTVSIQGNSSTSGNSTVGGTLTVSNTITGGNLATGGNLTVTGNSTVSGNSTISGNLTVTGNISAKGSDQQLQYNNMGNIAGAAALWNNANSGLTLANANVFTTLTTTNITTGGAATPGTITGQWTLSVGSRLNATYADLAERFAADDVYDYGTVMELGGSAEVTAVRDDLSDRVFGVVSETAGYLMNAEAGTDATHPPIAMQGRVKVKARGKVNKGDRLVSAGNGVARAAATNEATSFNVIGRSLENKTTDGVGHVLAAVGARTI